MVEPVVEDHEQAPSLAAPGGSSPEPHLRGFPLQRPLARVRRDALRGQAFPARGDPRRSQEGCDRPGGRGAGGRVLFRALDGPLRPLPDRRPCADDEQDSGDAQERDLLRRCRACHLGDHGPEDRKQARPSRDHLQEAWHAPVP